MVSELRPVTASDLVMATDKDLAKLRCFIHWGFLRQNHRCHLVSLLNGGWGTCWQNMEALFKWETEQLYPNHLGTECCPPSILPTKEQRPWGWEQRRACSGQTWRQILPISQSLLIMWCTLPQQSRPLPQHHLNTHSSSDYLSVAGHNFCLVVAGIELALLRCP